MTIELLCGMIASGKSTYARKRADAGALVVAHDGLTEMLHARYRYESDLRDVYRRMEQEIVAVAVDAGRDVVIDRTHLTLESRRRWVDFARQWLRDTPVIAVVFPFEGASTHARRRFESDPRGRSHQDWFMVAQHHEAQWLAEPIGSDEGFAEMRRMEATDAG